MTSVKKEKISNGVKFNIPKPVKETALKLEKAGYKAYLVGGCVRDLILGRDVSDWDIATDAKPEEIQGIFPESVYENKFGTVAIKTDSADELLKIIEVTTFRLEGKYTDLRHPDEVKFAKTIEEDLARRDFTVNAIALALTSDKEQLTTDKKKKSGGQMPVPHRREASGAGSDAIPRTELRSGAGVSGQMLLVDPYGGQADLKSKLIRAVGDPKKRFEEDALRLMRAVRLAAELDFSMEEKTREALKNHAGLIEAIAKERIRDELVKIVMAPRAAAGVILLEDVGLLRFIIPELREGIGVSQERHHIYTVFDHSVRALDYAAGKNYPLEIRLAALFHDVGKPKTRQEGNPPTFYNHEMVGARMTAKILDRLRFPKDVVEQVVHLVRYHMFYYNVGEVTEAGVRRFIARVGEEHIDALLKLREADRIGSGVPKAFPYKLRHLKFLIEKVKRDPVHPKMLKVKGDGVMEILNIPPGPKVGWILTILLDEVLDSPDRNDKHYLEERIKYLGALSDDELAKKAAEAKERKEEFEEGVEEEMKKKYHVK